MAPAAPPQADGRANARVIATAAIGSSLVAGIVLGLNGTGNLGWHVATKVTAILTFPLWWASFVAGPLAKLAPNGATRAMRRRRRSIGVAFASALAVHGVAILMLSRSEPEVITPSFDFFFGGLGFLFAFAMTVTSTDAAVRRLGSSRWHALHRTGQWILFVIFLATYGGRFAEDAAYWPGALGVLSALAIRVAAFARDRSLGGQAIGS